mmetsp:Transcript_16708/g.34389  ORF Transcript_16708/g.34389 Transcript_16708/m.34389 type:complete len:221 (-) Transcript_16708:90-752(-)
MRIGKTENTPNAHAIISQLRSWGASWVTVHGRSKTQRYSRKADWEYISGPCLTAARDSGIPIVGNGDIYNWEDVVRRREQENCPDAFMVARGALIKPWIFREIKEQRHWDISSSERLDIYKDFAKKGLEHWGADNIGVEKTRKFFLEWLSFLYRYIPVGLLETVPITMNHRIPPIKGRDHLETLMASHDSRDWIRISELVLGPAPENLKFTPRHKSNAWG